MAGIVMALALDVLALDVFHFPGTARVGALAVAALVGLTLILIERSSGAHQRHRFEGKPPEVKTTDARKSERGDRPAGGDSPASGARSAASSNVVDAAAARTVSATPPDPLLPEVPEPMANPPETDRPADGDSPAPPPAPEPPPTPSGDPSANPARSTHVEPERAAPEPEDLIRVWKDFWRNGNGHFKADGLRKQLADDGFTAEVIDGTAVGAGDHVLFVDPQSEDRGLFVLPSFAAPPKSVSQWFDDQGDGALNATTRQVIAVAVGRWTDTRTIEVVKKGVVS